MLSYTAAGEPWIEMRWLFCLLQYLTMEGLGPAALLLLKWLAVVVGFGTVVLAVVRRRTLVCTGLVLGLALLASSQRFLVRPELVSFALFGSFVFIVDRWRRRGGRTIWLLPLLQVVWVNTHPLFIFGPLVAGLLLIVVASGAPVSGGSSAAPARGRTSTAVAVFGATALACLANPYGVKGLLIPLHQITQLSVSVYREVITEFRSPFALDPTSTALACYWVLVILCVLSALVNLRRLDAFWLLLCASQLVLSMLSVRNLPLFCLAAVPFIVDNLERSSRFEAFPARALTLGRRVVASGVVVTSVWFSMELFTDRFSVRQNDSKQFGSGVAAFRYPVGAVDFIERQELEGRIFSTLLEGSYLVSRDKPVFADSRGDVYSDALLSRFLEVQRNPRAWEAAVRQYDIRIVVANLRTLFIRLLQRSGQWSLVYFDDVAAVFVRADSVQGLEAIDAPQEFDASIARIRAELPPLHPWDETGPFQRVSIPKPYLALADFLFLFGQWPSAETMLLEARRASPFVRGIPQRLAALMELAGDDGRLIDYARQALEQLPDDPETQLRIGRALLRQGDLPAAEHWLSRAVAARPQQAQPWVFLARVYLEQQNLPQAARALERAVALAPQRVVHRHDLARVQLLLGQEGVARGLLEDALRLEPGNVAVLRDLAALLVRQGDPTAARALIDGALVRAPDDTDLLRIREELE